MNRVMHNVEYVSTDPKQKFSIVRILVFQLALTPKLICRIKSNVGNNAHNLSYLLINYAKVNYNKFKKFYVFIKLSLNKLIQNIFVTLLVRFKIEM